MRRVCLIGLLLLVACSSPGGQERTPSPSVAPSPTTPRPVAAAPTCDPAERVQPGDTQHVLASGGSDRSYRLAVPPAYDGSMPVPLFINLHGYSSNAVQQDIYSALGAAASTVGGIVATPEGLGATQAWGLAPEGADAEFVSALIDDLESLFCIDRTRVAAVGISNGSALSAVLGCALADQLSAVGLVAATVGPLECHPDTRMSVIAFHGTDDTTVPYDGGAVTSGGRLEGLQVAPAEEAIGAWAEQDGCESDAGVEAVAGDVERWKYEGCEDGTAVEFYRVEGAGHVWPGSPIQTAALTERLGANTDSIDASALMVDFVVAHPREG